MPVRPWTIAGFEGISGRSAQGAEGVVEHALLVRAACMRPICASSTRTHACHGPDNCSGTRPRARAAAGRRRGTWKGHKTTDHYQIGGNRHSAAAGDREGAEKYEPRHARRAARLVMRARHGEARGPRRGVPHARGPAELLTCRGHGKSKCKYHVMSMLHGWPHPV